MPDETSSALTTSDPKPPAAPAVSSEQPRTLDIQPCPICPHNMVDGGCRNCGYGLTGERE